MIMSRGLISVFTGERIMEYVKANIVWADQWVSDMLRENTDMVNDDVRQSLEFIVGKNKSAIEDFNITDEDIEGYSGVHSCLVCNVREEDKGLLLVHSMGHLDEVIPTGDNRDIVDFQYIMTWLMLYRDCMVITRKVQRVAKLYDEVMVKNIKKMHELQEIMMRNDETQG